MKYNFREHGLEILEGVLTNEEADQAASDLDKFYSQGGGSRVVNLHISSTKILEAISKQSVADWIRANVNDFDSDAHAPTIYTTLSFQKGTQQEIHRDLPHFVTWPFNRFIGVWYALEDTNLDNGCLQYFIGGHSVGNINGKLLAQELFPEQKTLTDEQIDHCMKIYQSRVRNLCAEKNLGIGHGILKKGDVLIWHALLPHGGSIILDHAKTRKSVVAHCVPLGTRVYNARHYFDPEFNGNQLPQTPISQVAIPNGWHMQMQPKPFFQGKYL